MTDSAARKTTMQKKTIELKPGDIMHSGEIVQAANPGTSMGRKCMLVKLLNPKTGHVRVADWNLRGTVFMAKEQIMRS